MPDTTSSTSSLWHVRPLGPSRYRAVFCRRGRPGGSFEVVLTPWLRRHAGLPAVPDDGLVLCAVGLVLDGHLADGADVPPLVDLETLACVDPAFLPELRRRLGSGRRR